MDKLKKYLKEKEHDLSIEEAGDEVWLSIQKEMAPKESFLYRVITNFHSSFKKYPFEFRIPASLKWSIGILIPLFIFSCTYKINRTESVGTVIRFSLQPDNLIALQKLNTLQDKYEFSLTRLYNGANDYYLSYLNSEGKGSEEVIKALHEIPAINSMQVTPVTANTRETIFSVLIFNTFKTHIDKNRISKADLKKTIQLQLSKSGFNDISVEVLDNGAVRLSSKPLSNPAPVQKPFSADSIVKVPTISNPPVPSTKIDSGKIKAKDTLRPVVHIPTEADLQWLFNGKLAAGHWKGVENGDKVTIYYCDPQYNEATLRGWKITRNYDIKGIGRNTLEGVKDFVIEREAGIIKFSGYFNNGRGEGTYSISENPVFMEYLTNNVKGPLDTIIYNRNDNVAEYSTSDKFKKLTQDQQLRFFFVNINKEYIEYLKANGYAEINTMELYDLARNFVTLSDLRAYFNDPVRIGNVRLPVSQMIIRIRAKQKNK